MRTVANTVANLLFNHHLSQKDIFTLSTHFSVDCRNLKPFSYLHGFFVHWDHQITYSFHTHGTLLQYIPLFSAYCI